MAYAKGVLAKRTPRQALAAPLLDELEEELQRLRVAYERYFLGLDRVPPERERGLVERKLRALTSGAMGSTALRFRLDGLRGRFVTYSQHWRRICRQIETGSYVRVVAEAERRRRLAAFETRLQRERAKADPQQEPSQARERAAKTATPTPDDSGSSSPAEPARPSLGPPPGLSERGSRAPASNRVDLPNSRALYEQYLQAKQAAGQSTQGLSYSRMMQQIAQQMPKLRAQHPGKVKFEVASQNGRVRLLARRIKE